MAWHGLFGGPCDVRPGLFVMVEGEQKKTLWLWLWLWLPGRHAVLVVHEKPGTNGISAKGQGSPMSDKHGPPTGRLQALPMHTGNLARRLESSSRGQSGRVGPWLAARRTWLTPTGHAIPTCKWWELHRFCPPRPKARGPTGGRGGCSCFFSSGARETGKQDERGLSIST